MNEKNIFLAFDYGTTNIGVAVGQKITKSASILQPLLVKNLLPPWIKIDALIKSWEPRAIVVGMPCDSKGHTLKKITKLAQGFITQLKERYNLPIHSSLEHLTTKAAREIIFNRGGYKALISESIDSEAAKIILEEWMNNN